MPLNRTPFIKAAHSLGYSTGFSLTELLVAIAVGLVVVSGVLGIYVSTLRSNLDNLRMLRLNQELRAAMNIMVRDIRRAGFRGDGAIAPRPTSLTTLNPFATYNLGGSPAASNNLKIYNAAASLVPAGTPGSCIVYTYDRAPLLVSGGTLGSVDDEDKFGFRLDTAGGVGVIQARNGGPGDTDCSYTSTQPITDDATVNISSLNFSLNDIPVPILGVSGILRHIRTVTVTVTGNLLSDTTTVRTLTETVKLQNDSDEFS